MHVAILTTLLACQGPAVSSPSEPGPPSARPAVADLPPPDPGLAPGAPEPVGVLDLERARLGIDVPNSLKGIAVAWDPARQELWHAGIFSTWLIAHDPVSGAPLRAVDIEVEGFNPARMFVDAERRHLVWVNARKEQVRVVDLDKGELVEKIDVTSRGNARYPTSSNALDLADGRVWVFNANAGTLNGYDPTNGKIRPLTNITRVVDISAAPAGGRLAVIDAPSPDSGRVLLVDTVAGSAAEVCTFAGRPPAQVQLLDDGGMILADTRVRRVDAACNEQWSLILEEAPVELAVAGDAVVAPLATGGEHDGGIGSEVAVIDLATGALRARVDSRFEAHHLAVDEAGGRVFVGNGGDGSATVIPVSDPSASRLLSLASSADDVVVDPVTGDRFVLSRLGGSRIWRWKADGSVELFTDQAAWPFALELDPERRLLIAPSHFEARLYAWPLDGGAPRITDLGVPGSHGDALGELAYDAETGVAAVIFPMHGWLSVVDVAAGTVRYTRQFQELAYGPKAGPGKVSVAAANGSVYVAAPVEGKTWRLAQDTDRTLAQGSLPQGASAQPTGRAGGPPGPRAGGAGGRRGGPPAGDRPPRPGGGPERLERGNVYAFNLFHYDGAGGRLFYGGQVLDPDSLALGQSLGSDIKVFHSDGERVLSLVAEDGHDLIQLRDPVSLAVRSTVPALTAPTAHAEAVYDPARGVAWLADLPRARVTGFRVP